MTDKLSRRRFLRHASVGAAAASALAAGGAKAFGATGRPEATTAGSAARHGSASSGASLGDSAVLEGSGVIAHVVDAKTGQISLLVGTREIAYTNREMAQQLLRAAQ